MARYTGPRLRICRRLGGAELPGLIVPRELKRLYPPGQHGPTQRIKLSDYAIRLREKQKLRFHYGIGEKQFRRYMTQAKRTKGNTGANLLVALEARLDNVVFRLGYARTIRAARQMVRHGHVTVDDKKTSIPSYSLGAGQKLEVRESSKWKERVSTGLQGPGQLAVPGYVERDATNPLQARMKTLPEHEDCPLSINEALVVELYALSL